MSGYNYLFISIGYVGALKRHMELLFMTREILMFSKKISAQGDNILGH